MRKKLKKSLLIITCVALAIEIGVLAGDTYIYCKYKTSKLNLNGRIISEIDNFINFSGMASR